MKKHGTTARTEALAGLTTFLTMAYIIFVNPAILATDFAGNPTGLDPAAVLLATCVAAAVGSLLMGLLARYPIALAPGMGSNFLFVSMVTGLSAAGISEAWKTGLAIVFLAGAIFIVLSIFKVREAIIDAVSPSLRNGIAAGIGLFIAFIGLKNGGLVVDHPGTLVGMNPDLLSTDLMVFAVGIVLIAVCYVRRIKGAILIGIVGALAVALLAGKVTWPDSPVGLPQIENPAAFQLDFRSVFTATCLPFIFIFLFIDMFDTVGTLVGVSQAGGFFKEGKLPRAGRALMSDAVGTVVGAGLGTSTVTSYIESASGVEQGGRTGLTACVVAGLFLLALIFSPMIQMVGGYAPITAPALVFVGCMMLRGGLDIEWDDAGESLPAFLIALGIPLCFSIADGMALGFIAYPIVKLRDGERDLHKFLRNLEQAMIDCLAGYELSAGR
ncbi:MAG: solute carrier family 23 protein, partial [Verrucomicrobiota bacterium]